MFANCHSSCFYSLPSDPHPSFAFKFSILSAFLLSGCHYAICYVLRVLFAPPSSNTYSVRPPVVLRIVRKVCTFSVSSSALFTHDLIRPSNLLCSSFGSSQSAPCPTRFHTEFLGSIKTPDTICNSRASRTSPAFFTHRAIRNNHPSTSLGTATARLSTIYLIQTFWQLSTRFIRCLGWL